MLRKPSIIKHFRRRWKAEVDQRGRIRTPGSRFVPSVVCFYLGLIPLFAVQFNGEYMTAKRR